MKIYFRDVFQPQILLLCKIRKVAKLTKPLKYKATTITNLENI